MTPRRMTLQLTPLLDLLMILLFAQFLEVKTVDQQRAEAHQQALSSFQQKSTEYESQANLLTMRLNEARAQALRLQQQSRTLENSLSESTESIDLLQNQLQSVLRREETIARTLSRLMTSVTQSTEAMPKDLTDRLNQLQQIVQQGSSNNWVEHLLTYEELRKRCDVWELRLQADGVVTFQSGAGNEEIRLGSQEQLTDQLFETFKTWPQPKSMVVMMVSYGDAKRRDVKAFLDAIPDLTLRMRNDVGIRTQIEYALLGFRPETAITRPPVKPQESGVPQNEESLIPPEPIPATPSPESNSTPAPLPSTQQNPQE